MHALYNHAKFKKLCNEGTTGDVKGYLYKIENQIMYLIYRLLLYIFIKKKKMTFRIKRSTKIINARAQSHYSKHRNKGDLQPYESFYHDWKPESDPVAFFIIYRPRAASRPANPGHNLLIAAVRELKR